jgi:hypothetical protein
MIHVRRYEGELEMRLWMEILVLMFLSERRAGVYQRGKWMEGEKNTERLESH